MRRLILMVLLAGAALLLTGAAIDLSLAQKTANPPAAAKQEIMKAARAHGVKIQAEKIEYASNQKMTVVRAPIQGSDRYQDADFEKGAPMILAIIKSSEPFVVSNGSYVVKIGYSSNAPFGEAVFVDAKGELVAKQPLNQPLFPLDLPFRRDPCSRMEFPRIAITHPGPIPGPGGGYGLSFPCADCACDYYTEHPPRDFKSKADAGRLELERLSRALAQGDYCMDAVEPECLWRKVPKP